MANKDQAVGLRPYERLVKSSKYVAGSTVYPGDPVAIAADGQVDSSITVPLIGVALNYATAGQNVMVADDPQQLFVVQADGSLAASDIGKNCELILGTASTAYKRSSAVLDASNIADTATLAVKILSIGDEVDNAAGATNVDVVVKINNHSLAGSTGTAGL